MIKEVVLDVNAQVVKVKDEIVNELVTNKTIKNQRVITRIGKK